MTGTTIMVCAALMAIDGDTVRCCESATGKCVGQKLRPMGDGAPFISGFDTPEISGRSECPIEAELGAGAMARFAELLWTPASWSKIPARSTTMTDRSSGFAFRAALLSARS